MKRGPDLSKMCFVFGSNEAGVHGAGAAKVAAQKRGMPFGKSYGHYGECFAIPTKDEYIQTMPLNRIEAYVLGFISYAIGHRKTRFQVTQIGCGLAGLRPYQIAPMFEDAPDNCWFDEAWKPWLGEDRNYWGTMP